MPCSSNSHPDLDSNPHSQMSHNSGSPFMQSPRPPSRNVTPGNFHPRPELNSHAQMWLQNHPEIAHNQVNRSNTPSAMSTMTRYSGMSAISVNTRATFAANSPYASNQQLNSYTPGPLSTGSHSENIDPHRDFESQIIILLSSLADDTIEVRKKASGLLKKLPLSLKGYKPDISLILTQVFDTTVVALNRNLTAEELEVHINLCDVISELIRTFPEVATNLVLSERNKPAGLLMTLMKFAKMNSNEFETRRLRHLVPAFYFLFENKKVGSQCIALAKNTKLLEFLCQHVREIDRMILSTAPYKALQFLKVIHLYIDGMRMMIWKEFSFKCTIIQLKIHECVLRILEFFARNPMENMRLKLIYSVVAGFFKTLATINNDELISELVRSKIIHRLLLFRYSFHPNITQQALRDTYECLASVSDSKELLTTPIILATQNNCNLTIPYVISTDIDEALKTGDRELLKRLTQFVCNGNRMFGYCEEAVAKRQHEQILLFLQDATNRWINNAKPDFSDDVDTCLLILIKFSTVPNPLLFNQLCEPYFKDPFLFLRILSKKSAICTSRVLRIWSIFAQSNPRIFLIYSQKGEPLLAHLLSIIENLQIDYGKNEGSKNIARLAVGTYNLIAKCPDMCNEVAQNIHNLCTVTNNHADADIIELLIDLIYALYSLPQFADLLRVAFKRLLDSLKNSGYANLALKADSYSNALSGVDVNEFITPYHQYTSYLND